MTGQTAINEIDIAERFGAYLKEGELKNLLAYAPMKTPKSNDWYEEDGLEVDLSKPRLNSRELSLTFILKDKSKADSFLSFLIEAKRGFKLMFAETFVWNLRLISLTDYQAFGKDTLILRLKVSEDDPMVFVEEDTDKEGGAIKEQGNKIDGVSLADYGVCLLEGYVESIKKGFELKQGLSIKAKTLHGTRYDEEAFEAKKAFDFQMKCYLTARDKWALYNNYYALLMHLLRPRARVLQLKYIDETITCYYQSCSVQSVQLAGKPHIEFTLKMKRI